MIKYFIGLILLTSCGQNYKQDKKEKIVKRSEIKADTLVYKIIHYKSEENVNNKQFKASNLTRQEISKVENLLNQSIEIWNIEKEKEFLKFKTEHQNYKIEKNRMLITLNEYKRQYTPVINKENEKEVMIYCACDGYFGLVQDGGKCYFKLKVNLTKMTFTQIRINGIA